MNILVDIGHPAHVHLFRNLISLLKKKGHHVIVTQREKEITTSLLTYYNIPFINIGSYKKSIIKKFINNIKRSMSLRRIIKKENINVGIGVADYPLAWATKGTKCKVIIFTDSEPVAIDKYLTFPFADVIITPSSFQIELGKKQLRVNSYKELAYLHPLYYKPDSTILEQIGIDINERYAMLRFISWEASHDIGQKGFSKLDKIELVKNISMKMRLFISSENILPKELSKYKLTIPNEKFHDLLSFASLLVTDSQTVTTEAACLGTPVVRCNSFVGENDMGNFIELEQKYGLIYSIRESKKAIQKAKELIAQTDLKAQWAKKKERMLEDKIDLSAFMVKLIEGWPGSLKTGAGK